MEMAAAAMANRNQPPPCQATVHDQAARVRQDPPGMAEEANL